MLYSRYEDLRFLFVVAREEESVNLLSNLLVGEVSGGTSTLVAELIELPRGSIYGNPVEQ